MIFQDYPTRDALMQAVASKLAADLQSALANRDTVTFAVPGGTTPGPVFDALCQIDLDWSRVHVLLSDERWVPEDHAQSNAALIRSRLLQGYASKAAFTPYYSASDDINTAADKLSQSLSALGAIDVLLLGMGADMHTASLFPKAAGLEAAMAEDAQLLVPISIAGQEVQRFSLSAPALRAAGAKHILITGDEKREALNQAKDLSEAEAPIQIVLPDATVHWSAA
ncbi:6-phosphogluconolactonase [Sulfitobacter donghicola DSW-25 = KCTC 12864 = JCM 14565]|uniref:6-phosphogluconolactonase n=1 Tax=Sulfitobacter donghicola DSW-25 = KCTC 12864 = JCM 14565 TaxID=1300350 RepID=A0A073IG41_9RHOB|nr:6-phosphogluconolactonase [Sulfitobacter donghicola DSW-25 = KCTC 12864 = JCM 14565]